MQDLLDWFQMKENAHAEVLKDEEFYRDHWYLHPELDETKCSCIWEMRKKGFFCVPCQLGWTTKWARWLFFHSTHTNINHRQSKPSDFSAFFQLISLQLFLWPRKWRLSSYWAYYFAWVMWFCTFLKENNFYKMAAIFSMALIMNGVSCTHHGKVQNFFCIKAHTYVKNCIAPLVSFSTPVLKGLGMHTRVW